MKDVNSLTWLGTIKEELSELSWYHVSAADGLSITSFCPRPWNLVGRARGGQQRGAKHRGQNTEPLVSSFQIPEENHFP